MNNKLNRRSLFKLGVATIAAFPLLKIKNLFADELAWNACPTVVPEEIVKNLANDKAKARLEFVADATTSTNKKYEAGSSCGNCKFYKTKVDNGKLVGEIGGYATCSMLANKYVNRCGWCKSFKQDKEKFAIYQYTKKENA